MPFRMKHRKHNNSVAFNGEEYAKRKAVHKRSPDVSVNRRRDERIVG
jgi:hypothetical protein